MHVHRCSVLLPRDYVKELNAELPDCYVKGQTVHEETFIYESYQRKQVKKVQGYLMRLWEDYKEKKVTTSHLLKNVQITGGFG
ncbi:hypothetical protein E2C01_036072 [Portunus trituberculatus]|uniref:Uncharacterized protein n=1 Tax=Portunus trituberculatus TaxID=210409 RepID=A0A5B7F4U2_PORTR|nr:hypothetical protein [Portunus trituberculatus]